MSATQLKVINAVAFQLCWFACVLGGSLWALPAVLAFMIWHRKVATKEEWLFISVLSLSGIALDTLWYQLGVFSFDNYTMPVIPAWLALLWLAFSATLLHSLHTIFSRAWHLAGPGGASTSSIESRPRCSLCAPCSSRVCWRASRRTPATSTSLERRTWC